MTLKRVLVVDDNPINLKLAMLMLAPEHCVVSTATTARIALDLLRKEGTDLLLLDLQLPDMDGLALTRLLRAEPAFAHLPIVAVTAYAMKGDEEKARAAGVDAYITKPVAKEQFRRVVASFLNKGVDDEQQRRASKP